MNVDAYTVETNIFIVFFLSLSWNSPIVALECLVDEAIFEYIYIYVRVHVLGQKSFLFDAKKGKTSITAKRHEQFLFVATPIFPFFRERKDPRGNRILSRSESSTRFPSVNWNGSNSSSRDEPWVGILGGMPPRCWRY